MRGGYGQGCGGKYGFFPSGVLRLKDVSLQEVARGRARGADVVASGARCAQG